MESRITDKLTVNGQSCHSRRVTRHVRVADVQLTRVSAAAAVIRRKFVEVMTKISAAQRTATNPTPLADHLKSKPCQAGKDPRPDRRCSRFEIAH